VADPGSCIHYDLVVNVEQDAISKELDRPGKGDAVSDLADCKLPVAESQI
jgi:hypothetical protein